jgi:glycine cleavage system H protein
VTVKEVHVEVEDEPDLLNSTDKEDNWLLLVTDIDDSVFNSLNTDPFAE